MEIFGIIMLIILVAFALTVVVLYVLPFIVVECKSLSYRIKKGMADKKIDIDKRSEERQHRDERKREKDFELANRKLDAKLQKLDKQIKILDEKQAVVKELKKTTTTQKAELNKKPAKIKEPVVQAELAIPTVEETIESENE
mgnify:CR=1 FL=1